MAEGDRVLAAVAYVLLLLTGILVYVLAKPGDKYARWHALQAIGFGVVAIAVAVVLNVLGALLALGGAARGGGGLELFFGGFLLGSLWNLVVIVLVIVLALKAYQGEKLRLPVLAEFADKNA